MIVPISPLTGPLPSATLGSGKIVPVPHREACVDPADLGSVLRARRRQLGLTQEDAAALAGVSVRWLRRAEQGDNVRLAEVGRLAGALGLALQLVALEDVADDG